jgi:hypothetical protein
MDHEMPLPLRPSTDPARVSDEFGIQIRNRLGTQRKPRSRQIERIINAA